MSPFLAKILLLLAGATWGMGFIAQETAMDDIGPMLFVGSRFILAAIIVLPFAIREQRNSTIPFETRSLLRLTPVGVVFFLGMALQQIGLLGTSVTNAGFLTALYVILVPLILLIALAERQRFIIWPACAIALAGIWLLSGGELSALNWGDWMIVLCAFFWALHVILTGKIGTASGTPVTMATLQFFICGGLGIVAHYVSAITPFPEPAANAQALYGALPEILYAGIFAGAFAFTLQAIGQQYTSEASAAILLSSESLFAALFGAIILSERLEWGGYVGCAMIFIALIMVQLPSGRSADAKKAHQLPDAP